MVTRQQLYRCAKAPLLNKNKKSSPVHVALAYAGSREGSDHFGSYARSLSLHFCKRLFPGLEPMTSWSQGNSFTVVPGLPFSLLNKNRYPNLDGAKKLHIWETQDNVSTSDEPTILINHLYSIVVCYNL
jgi:hypothetical protein